MSIQIFVLLSLAALSALAVIFGLVLSLFEKASRRHAADLRGAFRTGWEIRQRTLPLGYHRGPPVNCDIDQLLHKGTEIRR